MEANYQARRVSRRKYSKAVHQLKSAPDPSSSPASRATLTNEEIRVLAELKPGFVERLDREKVASMDTLRLARLQRLVGWRLIPHAVKFSKMQAILRALASTQTMRTPARTPAFMISPLII